MNRPERTYRETIVGIKWICNVSVKLGSICAVLLILHGCSGAVSGPGTPAVGGDLLVLPAVADLFPDVPTQFSISGGKPGYSVFSSNSIVLPLDSTVTGTTFFATPKSVSSDTSVTITVRDADGKTKDATVIVKPAVINNNVVFTIVAPAGSGCGANALCSGGTAQVLVTAALNGTVLVNRPIRFAVFQGDFLFVTPGTAALVNSITINTDERGEAVVRLTAAVGAPPQVATLTSTDVTSGLVRRFNFNIVPRTLSVLPSGTVTFVGAKGPAGGGTGSGFCPSGQVDYYIFGGTPPYMVVSPLPGLASVTPSVVMTSGGSFTANLAGCGSVAFIVTDATQQTVETAVLVGTRGPDGSAPVVTTVAPPSVSPSTLTFTGCNQLGTVIIGGTQPITSTISTPGGNSVISVSPGPGGTSSTISRISNPAQSNPPAPNPIIVTYTNSAGTATLSVNPGPAFCPFISTSPSSVSVAAGGTVTSTVSGGTASYSVNSSNTGIATASISGTTVTIVGVATGTATITVRDSVGTGPGTIGVTVP